MAVPWLRLLDAALSIHDAVRVRRSRAVDSSEFESRLPAQSPAVRGLESRLANVVVAALKETFDRDSRRLELERQRLDMERERAERALQLEVVRQSAEREIGRLRFIAAVSTAIVVATFFVAPRIAGPAGGAWVARTTLGVGWLLLVVATWRSLAGQSVLAGALDRVAADQDLMAEIDVKQVDAFAPWCLVAGLALVGIAVLIS